MKIIITLFSVLFLFIFYELRGQEFNQILEKLLSDSIKQIKIEEITNPKKYIFLDTRERNEYKISHIKNSIWVGYKDFDIKRIKNISKDKELIVYCSIGYRSEKITKLLLKNGYLNAKNLYGGIFQWVNLNNPIYNQKGEVTQMVHAYNQYWSKFLKKGTKYLEP